MRVEGSDGRIRSTAIRDPLKGPFSMAKPELLKQFDLKGDSLEDKVNDFLQGDSIDKVDEIDALDNTPVMHVEAGNDTHLQHETTPSSARTSAGDNRPS